MGGEELSTTLPLGLVAAATLAYLVMARRQRASSRGWSGWRTGAWLAGSAVLALGTLSTHLPFAMGGVRQHMVEHLAIGMLAPIGLVLGAPLSLLLRSVPAAWARRVALALHAGPLRVIAHPVTALALNVGGTAALYFTPLYATVEAHPALHGLVHAHLLAAGCLYCWVVAGPDPAPHRPGVPARLVVLGVAIALHSALAQLLYAGVGVAVPGPAHELRGAAELMYYGGDVSELLLAFALVTTWQPVRRPRRPRAVTSWCRGAIRTSGPPGP